MRLCDVTHYKVTVVSRRALIPSASCFPRETKARHLLRITRNGHGKLEIAFRTTRSHVMHTYDDHTPLGGFPGKMATVSEKSPSFHDRRRLNRGLRRFPIFIIYGGEQGQKPDDAKVMASQKKKEENTPSYEFNPNDPAFSRSPPKNEMKMPVNSIFSQRR